TAAIDPGRPTASGMNNPGNNTEFFSGSNGSVRISGFRISPMTVSFSSLLGCVGVRGRFFVQRADFENQFAAPFVEVHVLSIANLARHQASGERRLYLFL